MKKFLKLLVVSGLFVCFITGCADVAESRTDSKINDGTESENIAEKAEIVSAMEVSTEEGYYMVEGRLCEIGKSELLLETSEEQILYFKLAPETIIYAGDGNEISEGQRIKVVFDGKVNGTEMEDVSVIAVVVL